MPPLERSEMEALTDWFAERGFGIKFTHERANLVWAELIRVSTGVLVAPRFGRGRTPLAAAQRAKRRYSEEQV